MKHLLSNSFSIAAILVMLSCNSGGENSAASDTTQIATSDTTAVVQVTAGDPNPTDSVPAAAYEKNASDTAVAAKISAALPALLEKQLAGVDTTGRKFIYYQTDLNDDGKSEYLVGFTGMNWCGSGGCTALLLSADMKLLTYFTVVDFPFNILSEKTQGWKNLVAYSGGSDRLLKWNGTKYPSNPSVAPKYSDKLPAGNERALGFNEVPYPWFKF